MPPLTGAARWVRLIAIGALWGGSSVSPLPVVRRYVVEELRRG